VLKLADACLALYKISTDYIYSYMLTYYLCGINHNLEILFT